MPCPRCAATTGGANFCPRCGLALAAPAPSPWPPAPPPPLQQPVAGGGGASTAAWVLVGVLMTVLVLGGGYLVLSGRGDSGGTPTAVAASSDGPTTPAPTEPTGVAATTAAAAAGTGDVTDLRGGLFCRDLDARGYSYSAAVDYWREHGSPNQMDADRNGIPCETVYPATDVSSYWAARDLPDAVVSDVSTMPSGLLCRDLAARGYSYDDAVLYWWYEGAPERMDVDGNGIPCETVYPASAVDGYW